MKKNKAKERRETDRGLGYQAIKLIPKSFSNRKKGLYYSKEQVDKILSRLRERIDYLSAENSRRRRLINIFNMYKKTMEGNHIFSPYDLEKHFENLKENKK